MARRRRGSKISPLRVAKGVHAGKRAAPIKSGGRKHRRGR